MMTRWHLMKALTDSLKELFAGYTLLNTNKELQPLQVFAQYFPIPDGATFGKSGLKDYAESDYESVFPCILVRLGEMTDTEERALEHSSVKVTLLTGVVDREKYCEGWQDILNIQDKARQYLLEHRVLGKRHVLRMPITSRLIDCETWPVYFGEMSLLYEAGRPAMGADFVNRRMPPAI